MSEIPEDLQFLKSHEWVRVEDSTARVGISDFAQAQLGDLVFVELPGVGANLNAGSACAVVESVKAASDIYSPVSGEVVAINEALGDAPELVNDSPYQDGWLFEVKLAGELANDELLNAKAYAQSLEEDD